LNPARTISIEPKKRLGGRRRPFGHHVSLFLSALILLSPFPLSSALLSSALAQTRSPAQAVEGEPGGHAANSTIVVVLKPETPKSGAIDAIDVSVQMPAGLVSAGAPLVRLPLVTDNVKTSATAVADLEAKDDLGRLALSSHDDPDGVAPYRHWTAARAVHGRLTLTYRIGIDDAPNARGAAPPYELRTEDGAFSGLLGTFVILPDSDVSRTLDLRWDLSSLPKGALGVSTLGVGDRSTARASRPAELENNYLMGGALGREPMSPAADGFFAVWQGSPPFDARSLMQWTHRLYSFDVKFFEHSADNYSIFLRYNPINAGGGIQVGPSFVGTFDNKTDKSQFEITLAHEMVHTFVEGLQADDDFEVLWYSEGLAVYYERVLPFRAGLIDRFAFLKDVNDTAARYYTDILNTTPNSGIAARFWADTRVRVLPYDRGALYFALVDEEVRKASGGARSLDDLVLEMLRRRRAGLSFTVADWRELVTKALGPPGAEQLDAMLAGKVLSLPSDSFGPCFERTKAPLRRYELGFTPDVLIEPKRVVRGLVAGSAAEQAGLRNGDHIVRPTPQDMIQSDQHALMHLTIQRDGQTRDISYLPRGETGMADQWMEAGTCK
jgi:hypothetical protein